VEVDTPRASTVGQAASEAFFVARFGSAGKPMVLVHGLGASHVHWLAVGPPLARRYRVLAPDLPGFGRTPLAGRDAGLEANARLIGRILDDLDQPAILVGHSMGALIAMLVSTDRPEKVSSLVLVTPPAPRPLRATFDTSLTLLFSAYCWPVLGEVTREIWVRATGPEGLVRHMFQVGCSSPSRVPTEVTRAALELARHREANGDDVHAFLAAYRSTWRFLANPFRFDRVVRSIAVPTLVIEGADDRLVPTIVTRRFRRLRQNWTFETLEGVGHMPHVELAAGFISKMTRWLNGMPGADRKGSGSGTPLPDQPQGSLEFLELRRS
jgi:pimeloyl-ACP methyl ester carboxylesterase